MFESNTTKHWPFLLSLTRSGVAVLAVLLLLAGGVEKAGVGEGPVPVVPGEEVTAWCVPAGLLAGLG